MATDLPDLPNDAAALQQMLLRTLAQLDAARTELAEKEYELQRVRHWLQQMLRHRYGQKRERVDENQLFLFAVQIAGTGQDALPEPKPGGGEPRPAAPGHGRQRLPQSLERRRVVYDFAGEERQCPDCHAELRHIGEEISEQLEYLPASLHVVQQACQKYACPRGCTVVTAGKDLLVALSSQGLDVPIIVIAQKGMEGDVIQAFRLGAADYLLWPIREAEVVSAVERVLKQVRARLERETLARQLKQTNQELHRRVRELTTIFAVGKAVTSITDQRLLFEKIVEGAVYITEADCGWLLLREERTKTFILSACRQCSPIYPGKA